MRKEPRVGSLVILTHVMNLTEACMKNHPTNLLQISGIGVGLAQPKAELSQLLTV
jgi:hypothetical protein